MSDQKTGFFSRVFGRRTLSSPDRAVEQAQDRLVIVHQNPIGSSGIQNYRGYYGEEYLATLRGRHAADIYDKMRRSESQIKLVLSAVKGPIKSATWEIEPGADDDQSKKISEFIQFVLFEDMDKPFSQFRNEMLTMLEFGHSVFEVTHKVVLNHPKYGHYNGIRSLGWRSPRTLERFMLDPDTGKLKTIVQYAYGDLGRLVEIPAEYCLVFTLDQEGDDYEATSMLRPCYGPWLRKQTFQKLKAIGVEKYAIPTPIAKVPQGKQNTEQFNNLIASLQSYTSHESAYQTIPDDFSIEFLKNEFDVNKIQAAIDGEDKDIVKAFVANFLEFGMSSSGGSYAMSFNASDFFLSGIEYIANYACEKINQDLIPKLVKMNFGPQDKYPKLMCSGIADRGGKELAESLKALCDSAAVIPDDFLEDHIRKRYKFPKRSDQGQRIPKQASGTGVPADVSKDDETSGATSQEDPSAAVTQDPALSERIRLAEVNAKKQIEAGKAQLKLSMQKGLKEMGQDLISQVMAKVKRLPQSQQLQAIKSLNINGVNSYKAEIQGALAHIATNSINQARKEIPKKKHVKLSENEGSFRFSEFDQLPSGVQKKVQAQSQLLVDSQLADLEKAVFFQFSHSVDSTDADPVLESDMQGSVDFYIGGASVDAAAGNSTALIVNQARNAFFFDDEVLDEVESFTFTNGDPVSPICQDLAGQTFAKDDPEAQRYFPPLHHNCKSYLVPNLVGGRSKEIGDLSPSKASLEQYITLGEKRRRKH